MCRGYFVELDGAVALATEAGAVAGVVADCFQARALLGGASVEGWVDIDERDRAARERAEGGEVFGVEDLVHWDELYRTWLAGESAHAKGTKGTKFYEGRRGWWVGCRLFDC